VKNFVIDAPAGAVLMLDTTNGRSLDSKLPAEAHWWVPEHTSSRLPASFDAPSSPASPRRLAWLTPSTC
jgi:hypothetical protein